MRTAKFSPVVGLSSLFLVTVAASVMLAFRPADEQATAAPVLPDLRSELDKAAALPGLPRAVSAGGVTRAETPLLTIENEEAFGNSDERRLVIVGGLNGDARAAQAVLGAITWFKTKAPQSLRQRWTISAMPFADPDRRAVARPYQFPPAKGFFDDPEQPESRYAWRWATFQAPDLVLEVWGGDAMSWQANEFPSLKATPLPQDSLSGALSAGAGSEMGTVPAVIVTARANDGPQLLQQVLTAAAGFGRSPLHRTVVARSDRDLLAIARVLAAKYPQNPILSYIPSVAWSNTLRLAAITNDTKLREKVLQQTLPWVSGERPLFGERIALTAAAGTMIFADLAASGTPAAGALAVQGAEAAAGQKPDGIAQYGQGWTDDMFMMATVLARTGKMAGRERDLDHLANRLISYSARLQRDDGIFVHFTDGRQAWGRGNGFAALGLTEALTSLPPSHPSRAEVLAIYRRHMNALKSHQAPDGMWRQIVDQPGAYREESVTAMVLTAMARGIRLGWLDKTYRPTVDRAWRALAAHITEDGGIVDVCTGTGAGPTRRYYFDRQAINGPDDRGGAMALLATMGMYALK